MMFIGPVLKRAQVVALLDVLQSDDFKESPEIQIVNFSDEKVAVVPHPSRPESRIVIHPDGTIDEQGDY